MAKYDTEKLNLTPRFVESLQELMEANMEMMREHDPDMADCWAWGICEVNDLANSNGLSFTYGGDEDRPDELPDGVNTLVVEVDLGGKAQDEDRDRLVGRAIINATLLA